MEETFECSHKMAFASKDGGGKYSIYITKDDGTDMTIYGEALGFERWQKGARLKITAEPKRQSKNGKWYQTATSVELLEGEVAVPTGNASAAPAKDPQAQWKEKYRLTMSYLKRSYISCGKMPTDTEFQQIDKFVKKILDARYEGEDAPF